jgi:hypothetical protein
MCSRGRAFAEPVADFQHSRTCTLVCFIVSAERLTHIGLGRRGVRAGTGLSRLNIDKVEELSEPLSVRKLLNRLPKRNAASVRKRFQSGGLLTDKGFTAVVETIRQIAPQASTLLDRFSQARTAHPAVVGEGERQLGAAERSCCSRRCRLPG